MKVVIVGVGTTAMIVADIIIESHNFKLAGFVGTAKEEKNLRRSKVYHDAPFLGDHSILSSLKNEDIVGFIAAVGDNQIREKLFYKGTQAGLIPVNAVSSKANINPDVSLGKGAVISPGAVLSHGVSLGNNIILDPSVTIDVNCSIGDHCYMYSGTLICGGCVIEKNVTLEAGVIVEPNRKIGKNNHISAGTVVRKDIKGLYRKEA
ncbi:hypothetical protein ACFL0T_02585 [Candidatus Omnitrophota bacterium]